MILNFYIRFSTKYGQTLYVSGSNATLGNNDPAHAIPLKYFNEDCWHGRIEIPAEDLQQHEIEYRYLLREEDGNQVIEWGNDRIISHGKGQPGTMVLIDTWNHAGQVENSFYTKAYREVLLKSNQGNNKPKKVKTYTHAFKVKSPLLKADEVLCIAGSGPSLGEWNTVAPLLLHPEDNWWVLKVNLAEEVFPVAYKYGVYNTRLKSFQFFEAGKNRILHSESGKPAVTIIHDGFAQMPFPQWKGAGVAIPVFSLRSSQGLGTGEFTDIKLLVDWAKLTGLKMIQLLPVNDTTATHTYLDSYPYAAISAFALHPLYLNLEKVAGSKNSTILQSLATEKIALNNCTEVDYVRVMELKFDIAGKLFLQQKNDFLNDTRYFEFFDLNRHWLVPYAVFCYLRDKYKTADYNQWKTQDVFDEDEVQRLASPGQKHYDQIALHYFIQYHLHLQLNDATAYAHRNGIVVKGDLPIGIYRYGCDAWMAPQLYNMNAQAGAPPDDFAIKGQNWGFPTYNWKKMQEDGFAWWRKRFEQMSAYFDAFRIDHILGFFRIWSIPLHAVEGIMGRFVPAIPIHRDELHQMGISFNHHRYCLPYIPAHLVWEKFGDAADAIIEEFLFFKEGTYQLKPIVDTQRKVEAYFSKLPASEKNKAIRAGLFDLVSNVILFEDEGSQGQQYHFRINMDQTASFRDLDEHSKYQLKQLYINYFFKRQDDFWRREALNKLPGLKRSTDMLVCGEDLGMVPACVPEVMEQLGILSLEIQRMPKDSNTEFFHPASAPYLSVVTPSTHDMSTIRGWWEEDPAKTQRFYNTMLGHNGQSPFHCEASINREIVIQHLYSPAMWSIFQLQDILGIDEKLRRDNPHHERINVPADPKHYWQYRMHVGLEALINETAFNKELASFVEASGR